MTKSLGLVIDPIDTLMFRDGRPFNQSDEGASEAVSVFPPYPPTIVGAVRAALWGAAGGVWDEKKLGNGTNWQRGGTLGPLSFSAPLVMLNQSLLFPAPLHIVKSDAEYTYLSPGTSLKCDLGEQKLPTPIKDLAGLKTLDGEFVTEFGVRQILDGAIPSASSFLPSAELWKCETRVGIGIDRESRRTDMVNGKGGKLYMASHIRMCEGAQLYVSYEGHRGEENPFIDAGVLKPLAGEHRMARMQAMNEPHNVPEAPSNFSKSADGKQTLYLVYLISPCVLDCLDQVGEILGDQLVSACIGKPQMIGGWNSQEREAIPLRPAIPAGSVWFMESVKSEDEIRMLHGTHIGIGAAWGFGQILIGKWIEREENQHA